MTSRPRSTSPTRSTSRTVFTAHSPGDVIASLPTMFGFSPQESFVAVATHGPRNRFGFCMRVDLPPAEHADEVARTAVGHLRRNEAEGAMLLALTDDHARGEAMVRAALAALPADVEPIVVVWADGRRYWQPLPGFPSHGVRYDASPHHRSVVQAIAEGQVILPDREALVARFAACTGEVRRRMEEVVAGELDRVLRIFGGQPSDSGLLAAARAEIDPILRRALRRRDRMSDRDVAVVALWCASVVVRDHLMTRIRRDEAEQWLRVLTEVAGRVTPGFEPSVLCLAGFAAYRCGDGTQALIALERALDADPDHHLGQLLMQLLQAGVPPEDLDLFQQLDPVQESELDEERDA
jgi:hypothetical protein